MNLNKLEKLKLGNDIKLYGFSINIIQNTINNKLYRAILFVPMKRDYIKSKIDDLTKILEQKNYKRKQIPSKFGEAYLLYKKLK